MIFGIWLGAMLTSSQPRIHGDQPWAPIKDYGLAPYSHLSQALPHREDHPWKLVCTIPHNCQFQPWIEVLAPEGKVIQFNSTNPLVLYLTPTETVKSISGQKVYEARNWISGEGAIYTIPAGVEVKQVKYRETGYNTTIAGSFKCNDDDYNILWKKAARTSYLCMRDHFYDCPDRERVGFWGDGTPELDTCFYAFDTASHQLCRELVLRKLEPEFYPGQHLEFLGDYGLWYYYMQTGDLNSVSAVYDQTKTFLLLTYKAGVKNTWFDWGADSKDTSVLEDCFMYTDLGALRRLAVATNHEVDLPAIDAKRTAIKAAFDRKYWKEGAYKSNDVTTPDDRANAMAINSGLASQDKWGSIYDKVLSKTQNSSCFFDRWVFEALCKMGMQDKALLRMATRYRTMISASFSTLWEHYDRWWASWINAFDDASSLNHGWNPPVINLSQDIAGIRPIQPGWASFEVLPKEAFLTSIRVAVPTIKGLVRVSIKKTSKTYGLQLTVPANCTAVAGVPVASFDSLNSISLNGSRVWTRAVNTKAEDVTYLGVDGGYVQFKVGPGNWNFVGHGSLPLASPKAPAKTRPPMQPLDKSGWIASASVPDSTYPFSGAKIPIDTSAANAVDGDHWTGWRDMTKTQYPGQWFQVDMGKLTSFNSIVLDNSWALWDSPNRYEVTVSEDGEHWSNPVASGSGELGITNIHLNRQSARFIRVTQTGSSPLYHWSIFEFNIYDTEGADRVPRSSSRIARRPHE